MLQRNIKTPSVPIARQWAGSSSPTIKFHRGKGQRERLKWPFSLFSLLLLAVSLTACASGNAREAEPFATKDAEKTAVVSGAHETAIVERFFPTPGTPAPTATPIAVLETLVLTTSLGPNNEPQQEVRGASGSGTLYADALVHHLTKGSVASAVWTNNDGTALYSSELPISENTDTAWLAFQWNVDGSLPHGDYIVYVYVDDWLLNSLVFQLN
jgi:hypothetical protein